MCIRDSGRPLVSLDNAATTQMPESVLSVMTEQYRSYEAKVHRGIHYLSEKSTQRMEKARATIAKFLNARASSEIIFTSGTTSAINTAAACLSDKFLNPGDEILVTAMEHQDVYKRQPEYCAVQRPCGKYLKNCLSA